MFTSRAISVDAGLLILRLASGLFMFINHGLPKLMGFSEMSEKFPDPVGVGSMFSLVLIIFAEVVCALLVALGLFTRAATIPLVIAMAVAAFIVHSGDPFTDKEFALIYLAAYLTLFFAGSGKYAVDRISFR